MMTGFSRFPKWTSDLRVNAYTPINKKAVFSFHCAFIEKTSDTSSMDVLEVVSPTSSTADRNHWKPMEAWLWAGK
jgi:hypothetical protein